MARAAAMFLAFGLCAGAQDLESRIRDLEIRSEGAGPSASSGEGKLDFSAFFDDGLHIKGGDGAFDINIGGHVIWHGVYYTGNNERTSVDTNRIREAHLRLQATVFEHWNVYVVPDLGTSGSPLYEGWAEFSAWEIVKVRAGQMKVPYSREALEMTQWQDFPEDPLTERHNPGRDIGVLAHGILFEGLFDYAIGVFNGNGFATNSDENSDKDVAGYIGISPFAKTGWDLLKHFRLGFGTTQGRHDGDDDETPFDFEVPDSRTEFATNRAGKPAGAPVVKEQGDRERYSGDVAITLGPLDLKGEISRFRTELEIDDSKDVLRSLASSWSVGWWFGGSRLAGERPKVRKPLFGGGYGALHIGFRYSKFYLTDQYVEDAGFEGTNHIREYSAALNWYPTENVRISIMYTDIEYGSERVPAGDPIPNKPPVRGGGGGAGGSTSSFAKSIDDERLWTIRLQVDF